MKNTSLIAHCLLLGCLASFASIAVGATATQPIKPLPTQAMESLFSEVNSPAKPALAVALLKNGEVIYQKAFGSVNLEYQVPATIDTRFQVDTLAWEFIAFATFKLEEQGKIRMQDDIRKYLPELPDFASKISINHLLSSTDGLHGYKVLKALGGWEAREPGPHKGIVQLIKHQKILNFTPGQVFSPGGDTRLILLAKIVEAASGQPFADFCATHIFMPLGMSDTVFVDDNSPRLENTAVPYRQDGKGSYKFDYGNGNAAGATNLYTSIRDLSLWRASFSGAAPGKKRLTDKLALPLRLDSGKIIKDISSISIYGQQHAGLERGTAKIYQTGSYGGYASAVFHFPDQNVTAIALSSGLAYSGNYAMQLASLLLKNHFTEPATIDYARIAAVKLSPEQLGPYVGNYWAPERALAARIHLKNDVLHYSRVEGADGRALIPLGGDRFQLPIEGDDKYLITFADRKGSMDLHFTMGDSDPVVFARYAKASYTQGELAQFTGTFHSRELNSSFVFAAGEGQLTASNIRVGTINFKPVLPDLFTGDRSFMGGVRFIRAGNRDITGLRIVVDEVRTLEFSKIEGYQGAATAQATGAQPHAGGPRPELAAFIINHHCLRISHEPHRIARGLPDLFFAWNGRAGRRSPSGRR